MTSRRLMASLRHLSTLTIVTMLCFGAASCGTTEPKLADGEFVASMKGSVTTTVSGEAAFMVDGLGLTSLELRHLPPASTADGEMWGIFFVLPTGVRPGPNMVVTVAPDRRVSLLHATRTNGTTLGTEWEATSGELKFESASQGLLTGTFSLATRLVVGTGTMTVRGSFRATCSPTTTLPGTTCE